MLIEIKPFLAWVSSHPNWAGITIFTIIFLESLLVFGMIIPGSAIMVAIGSLIGTGYIPLLSTILWAVSGALIGDLLSYTLGFYFNSHLRNIWPLRSFPQLLAKGEKFFAKHGGKSVFMARFAGPIRSVVPMISGMLSMSPIRFLLADIPSAFLWTPIFLLPGILLGTASQALGAEAATQLIIFVILLLVSAWCLSWLLKLSFVWTASTHHYALSTCWQFFQQSPRWQWLEKFLRDPQLPKENHVQLNRLFLFFICSLLFFILAINVHHHGALLAINEPVYHFMRSLRTVALEKFFVTFTLFGTAVFGFMWAGVAIWLVFCRRWAAALHWLAIGILIFASTEIVKHWTHSPRPTGLIKTPKGWSFPSGHTTASLTFLGFLAVLLTREWLKEQRYIVYAVVAIFSGLIMVSRLYLMAHWLTDVVGGCLLALSCILLVSISYHRQPAKPVPFWSTLGIAMVCLFMAWGWKIYTQYQESVLQYSIAWPKQNLSAENWWQQDNSFLRPMYRSNRFGKHVQILNVQWEGQLKDIETRLSQHGWYKLTKPGLILAINSLAAKDTKNQPYFLDQIYDDRKAVFEMAKILQISQKPVVVMLRLWNSHLMLDNNSPLWVGTVSYRKPWQMRFLKQKNTSTLVLPAITNVLAQDLQGYEWKKIAYHNLHIPKKEADINWDGHVLLIREMRN